MAIKIAMLGAGSVAFTRCLIHDILAVPELQDTEFALMDINKQNLDMISTLAVRDIRANKLPARLHSTTNRRVALRDANYVFSFIRAGGLDALQNDIEIPLKYGVDQCVGDTLGPGGIMYGQRGIPVTLDICKDIREVAAPNCVFMNYVNPMAMITWAANQYGGVKTIGLCHGVHGSWKQIADVLKISMSELDVIAAGINHQTWFISVKHRGKDMTGKLLEGFEKHPVYSKTEKVRIDMLRRYGFYTTESNGHVSEYVPFYRKRPQEIRKWIDLSSWINGETGGYLRVSMESRKWFEHDYPNWMKEEPPTINNDRRSPEHGSYIIEAMETGRIYRGHFNVVNHGCITNLPDDCIVEVPGYIDRNGLQVPFVGALPLACAATCNASIQVQRMAVQAAVHGDPILLKQAMLHDPLTAAVCNPPEIWQMADELLVANAEWLPRYQREIPKARHRIASSPSLARHRGKGAARLKVKTIKEMSKDLQSSRRITQDTDKAQYDRNINKRLKKQ